MMKPQGFGKKLQVCPTVALSLLPPTIIFGPWATQALVVRVLKSSLIMGIIYLVALQERIKARAIALWKFGTSCSCSMNKLLTGNASPFLTRPLIQVWG